ncbi:hypothetical protein LOAG_14777 [Loa loa]|uniref:Uncharacterized protein n=1 Tax=Loa loa TaxID=7209 RepID=A0A1S0TH24_LOALO|nr:hypothetical protein LOAG_14777 [Loa loa]EFO13751.2 hypothetical protein LOAG_14777 [Loa loa]
MYKDTHTRTEKRGVVHRKETNVNIYSKVHEREYNRVYLTTSIALYGWIRNVCY